MAKSRKKSSGPSESNPKAAIGILGGLVVAGAAYVFIKGGAQAPVPQGPPPPPVVPQVAVAPAVPDGQNSDPAAAPMPAPTVGALVPKSPETGTTTPAVTPSGTAPKPAVGQLLPKPAPAADTQAASTGRVRPRRRPTDQVQVTAQEEEDLDTEPRPSELAGYSETLKLTGVGYNAEKIGEWEVQPDPLPEGLPANTQAEKLKAKINATFASSDEHAVLFPAVPSAFVVVGGNSGRGNFREIFSLESGRTAGQIKGVDFTPVQQALSPDGKFYAAIVRQSPHWIEVWDVQKKVSLEHLAAVPEDAVDKPAVAQPAPMNDAIKIGKPRPTVAFQPAAKVPDDLMPKFLAFPRPDRLLVASESRVQMWSIPDRESVSDFQIEDPFATDDEKARPSRSRWNREGNPIANMAISPGGRYAAVMQTADRLHYALNVFDLAAGKSVGQFDLERRKSNFFARSQFHTVAFSPDGKELAALFETDKGCRILVWDLAAGKIVDWVQFGLDQKPRWGRSYTPLAWFPSGNRFLVDGQHIIDRQADAWLYSLPDSRHCIAGSRRVVNEETVTVVDDDDFRVTGLVGYQLDTATLDRATEIIVGGGSAVDSVLPPLTKVDGGEFPDMTEQAEVPWSVKADTGPKLAEKLSDASAKVPEVNRLTQVLNSRVDGSRAFFGFPNPDSADPKKSPRRIEAVDLLKKKPLKPLAIEYPFKLFSSSPKGTRLALRADAKKPTGRIEIYDVDGGAPLCGWRPYDADQPEEKRKDVHAALFIDDDHVATLSHDGRFVMWEIPACKPLYSRDLSLLVTPTVSPGGKYLAFVYDDAVELCDALTGELQGEFLTGNPAVGIAFHPKGNRMAVLLEATGNRYLTDVDLTTGKMSPTYVVPGQASEQSTVRERAGETDEPALANVKAKFVQTLAPVRVDVQWCEHDRVLIDHSQLFDFEQRRVVWTYTTKQPLVWLNAGDGRLWYATPARVLFGNRGRTTVASRLLALALPQDEAEEVIADNADRPVRLILKPKGEISVKLNLIAPPDDPNFLARVRSHLEREFAKVGITVTDTPAVVGAVELTLDMTQGSGENRTYRRIGAGGGGEESLSVKTVTLQASIRSGGQTHWECTYSATNSPGFIAFSDPKLGLQGTADRNLWQSVATLPYRFRAPAYVIHRDDQNGFGTTELSDQGYVKKGADSSVTSAP